MHPPAPHRVGQPSPLIFHLNAALAAYGQALLAAPRADSDSFPWADGLGGHAAALGGDLDQLAVAREIASRLAATIEGLEVWQTHPYRRLLADPPAVWHAGCSRLLDYGAAPEAAAQPGRPLLVVPSLINRAYVLDLVPGRSMLRWLAAEGFRPLLMDWGEPGPEEAHFDLDAYGTERLLPALAAARALAGGRVPVLGYCMGGTLAVGLAARRPDEVSALVTIGAPWDFASTRGVAGGIRAMLRANGIARAESLLDGLGETFGQVPVSVFQTLFAMVNPIQASLKFQKLARLDPDGQAARLFVALEDWLAEGVPMPAGAARDLLVGWQIRNLTAGGGWRFLGGTVDPRAIRAPALVVSGARDSIAPPPLAEPLGRAIPGARTLTPQTGHVGMVVGSLARPQVWRPIAAFLAGRDPHPPSG
jgi:polyhydroxyalkanoate synthase